MPGATAEEVERRLTSPLEKAIYEIPNVEYVYSTTQPSGGMIIVRYLVGTDPDQAAVRGPHQARRDRRRAARRGAAAARRAARHRRRPGARLHPVVAGAPRRSSSARSREELKAELTRHPRVAQVRCSAGERRAVHGDVRPRAPGRPPGLDPAGLPGALRARTGAAGRELSRAADREIEVEVGRALPQSADEVGGAVVGGLRRRGRSTCATWPRSPTAPTSRPSTSG